MRIKSCLSAFHSGLVMRFLLWLCGLLAISSGMPEYDDVVDQICGSHPLKTIVKKIETAREYQ